MGKKKIATMIVAVIAVAASYNVYKSQKTNTLSDLALANVEALANGEGSGVSCYCGKVYGKGCKADNSGSSCNPDGSSDCWKYDRNCS